MEVVNATIRSTILEVVQDVGVLSASLVLDFGGSVQSFGGWTLDDAPAEPGGKRRPTELAGLFISRVLEIAGVSRWEKLPNRPIRVGRAGGWNSRLVAIGHYLEDDWFHPDAEFAKLEKEGR